MGDTQDNGSWTEGLVNIVNNQRCYAKIPVAKDVLRY